MKLWQKSWRHPATSVKVLLNVADGQHNYVRSVCVWAGRCVGATHSVAPCEDLGISILLGFGDQLASLCIAPLSAAARKGLVHL